MSIKFIVILFGTKLYTVISESIDSIGKNKWN